MPFLKKTVAILFGSLFLSIGINLFLVPFELLDGGIIGIGLIVNYLTGMKTGLTIILFSIPIFILAWIYKRSYFYNSLHGMLFSSLAIDLLFPFHDSIKAQASPIISSIVGGILVGIGIGIMLRHQTSTGGTDLLAQFLSKILHLNVGFLIFIIDLIVICIGSLLISKDTFLFSMIAICFIGLTTTVFTWKLDKA